MKAFTGGPIFFAFGFHGRFHAGSHARLHASALASRSTGRGAPFGAGPEMLALPAGAATKRAIGQEEATMTTPPATAIDEGKLHASWARRSATSVPRSRGAGGDRRQARPLPGAGRGAARSPAELAGRTGTTERYVREWLAAQAAGGYVDYDAATGHFSMSEEQKLALAVEDSPVYVAGAFQVIAAAATSRRSPRPSAPARASAGTSTTRPVRGHRTLLPPDYARNLSRTGCRRWTAWWPSSSAAPRSPTSAVATAPRRC